jgi:DNA-binding PadR family transcriptional regulator
MARRQSDVAWPDPALLILGSLASGPKHGSGIVQGTESTVGITLGPGTLYAALSRLEEPDHVVPSQIRAASLLP